MANAGALPYPNMLRGRPRHRLLRTTLRALNASAFLAADSMPVPQQVETNADPIARELLKVELSDVEVLSTYAAEKVRDGLDTVLEVDRRTPPTIASMRRCPR